MFKASSPSWPCSTSLTSMWSSRRPSSAPSGGRPVSRTADLSYHSIREAADRIQARTISPVELTQACLDRIAEVEPTVQAFVTVLAQPALAAAREAEAAIGRGEYGGPLHGIPIALKDLYHMQGIPTTASSKLRVDYVPTYDAAATERLAD